MTALLPDRPALPATVAAVVAVVLAAVLLLDAGGDVSELVHAAPPVTDPSTASEDLTVLTPDDGFDGQFYYRLAIAPFDDGEVVAGVHFDLPELRNQRIGYPLLAYGASAGQASLVPEALLALNLIGFVLLGALGGALARAHGHHAAWGLLVPLYPGFVYSLAFDLAEIVASAFLLAGLLALRRHHVGAATLALTAAVLCRETAAVVPVGIVAAWAWASVGVRWRRESGGRPTIGVLATGVVPLAVAAAWQVVVAVRWDELPLRSSGAKNVRVPFEGLVSAADAFWPPTSVETVFRLLSLALLVTVVTSAAARWRSSTTSLAVRLAWLPAVLLLPLLSEFIWAGATSFMRAGIESYLLSLLVLAGAEPIRRPAVGAGAGVAVAGMWTLTAASEVIP